MAKKNYVLDTSVYLTDADALIKFGNNDIFIPLKVLEEVDKHKTRQDSVGVNARRFIRSLDELREKGNLKKGVRLGKGLGVVRCLSFQDLMTAEEFPSDLDLNIADHIIIATAFGLLKDASKKVIVVSRDINMRVICDSLGIPSEDYVTENVVTSSEELYSGFSKFLVDDQIVSKFYDGGDVIITREEAREEWFPNQFIMLVSNSNEKKTCLARFKNHYEPLKKIRFNKIADWKIAARNKEQEFAIDLLLDPDIKVVSLVGRAGSGKTLCAVAAGLQQTIGSGGKENKLYDRMIVSRPVQPLGKDIGFLPGTMEEKMLPWLMPIQDNLQFLLGGNKKALETYMEKGKIEIEALTYIRGRSIANTFMIIDEAQNLTSHEVKTIMTRVGEGTKIILTGDIEQIDNVYVNETSNGLAHAVEKLKEFNLSGHVTFTKGERSEVATLASKVL